MYSLPISVEVKGKSFTITNKGDFRMVLDCFGALNDEELSEDLRALASLIIFYNELNDKNDLLQYKEYLPDLQEKMVEFINGGDVNPSGANVGEKLVDWEQDSNIICAAINNVAHLEIRAVEYMHWFTFLGYYMSIGESVFSTVVAIRKKIKHREKLEKWETDFYRNNTQYFVPKQSKEDAEFEKELRRQWNGGM